MQEFTPEKKVSRARTLLLLDRPFFGTLALKLEMIPTPFFPTACTDGKRMFYNPRWVSQMSMDQLKGLIAHEVMHCSNGHMWRMGARDAKKWAMACDLAINPILIEAKMELPDCNWEDFMRKHQIPEGSVERIYNHIPERKDDSEDEFEDGQQDNSEDGSEDEFEDGQQDNSEDGSEDEFEDGQQDNSEDGSEDEFEDGQGSDRDTQESPENSQESNKTSKGVNKQAQGEKSLEEQLKNAKDPFKCGGVMQACKDADAKEMEAEWKHALIQAGMVAGAGNLPAGVRRMIDDIIDPELPVDVLLRDFLEQTARDDYNWAIPSRRFTGSGFILPGLKSEELPDVVFVSDTSCSVTPKEITIYASVLSDILGHYNTIIHYIDCDADIQKVRKFTSEDLPLKIDMYGGGGTDFHPPFKWVEEQGIEPSCLMYLTDMEPYNGFPPEPDYPVVWLSTGSVQDAPYGQVFDLRPLLDKV